MADPKDRFVTLPPQTLIDPGEPEVARDAPPARRSGLGWTIWYRFLDGLVEVLSSLLPYLLVAGVLALAIAVFFGVSVQAAMILLGLGAVGLGVLFAASQGS